MSKHSLQHELRKKQAFAVPEEEAYLNLLRTQAVLGAGFEQLFRSHGLTEATYNVLRILRGAGEKGRMCHEIGEDMVARVPDVTRLVDRLEKAGFVTRRRCDQDRRVVHVAATRKGLDLLALIDEPLIALHRRTLGHLSRRELAELSRLLYRARHPEDRDG